MGLEYPDFFYRRIFVILYFEPGIILVIVLTISFKYKSTVVAVIGGFVRVEGAEGILIMLLCLCIFCVFNLIGFVRATTFGEVLKTSTHARTNGGVATKKATGKTCS